MLIDYRQINDPVWQKSTQALSISEKYVYILRKRVYRNIDNWHWQLLNFYFNNAAPLTPWTDMYFCLFVLSNALFMIEQNFCYPL